MKIEDFNANHPFFGPSKNTKNHRGELLYNICKLYNLDFLGPDFHTFHSGKKKGKPDLVMGNNYWVSSTDLSHRDQGLGVITYLSKLNLTQNQS